MHKPKFLIISLFLLLSACRAELPTPISAPNLESLPARIIISEVLAGLEEDNQADYIELYNAGTEIADLKGYSLWYQLSDDSKEVLVYRWNDSTLVPPLGYYALVLEGEDFPVLPDAVFSQPLVPNRGGLSLREGDSVRDQLAWGTGPTALAEGKPAPALAPGQSLERNLDPERGLPLDTDNNRADFVINPAPILQNSGSPLNHPAGNKIKLIIDFPEVVKPGEEFYTQVVIQNSTGLNLTNLSLYLPLPNQIGFQDSESGLLLDGTMALLELADGERFTIIIPLQAETTFANFSVRNAYVQAENWPLPSFSGPIYGEIGGGPIPVGKARSLIDKDVVVQGVSTMYVGGFYAGSGAKFYLEDETGGIQVYVAGAGSSLVVPLGSTVQVRGKIEVYRDSLELVPASQEGVQIIAGPGEGQAWDPLELSIEEISLKGNSFSGSLIAVQGRVARIEEFSFSYEIDLFDESGNLVSLYIDKETGITLEQIEADQFWRVTGILELLDGVLQLYPRLQSDLARVYEPGLAIQVHPPTTAQEGEIFEVVYTVINHAPDPDRNLVISARVDPDLEVLEIQEPGHQENNTIIWDVNSLAGGGGEVTVSFKARITGETDFVSFDDYLVISSSWPEPATGMPSYTFLGESVPIWAIQGPGSSSPYVLSSITTQGVVTGVFPGLEGFWIQELESDTDPATSPGIFVRTGPDLPQMRPGDLISLTGQVRESYQQTELELISASSLNILGKASLPDPVELEPPLDDQASALYYEALEGVLVSVAGSAIVVGPTTRYGEFAVVQSEYGQTRSWQDADHGRLIHIDDGSSVTHEYRDTLDSVVAVGDSVSRVEGPLAFSFGNYKIEPIRDYLISAVPHPTPSLKPLEEGYFSIMTWNVENLFDFLVPHPSSPALPSVSEYKRDIGKVALTIQAAGYPTVVGLQEVENLQILEDIAAEPILADYDYQGVLIEGTDSRGIDVGYLVRGDQAKVIDQSQYPAPGNITSRPPLLVAVELVESSGEIIYILNNHFTSMSGGEGATEPRRVSQAAWNLEIAHDLQDQNPGAYLAIIGDLNSYYNSPPLQTILEGGFTSVFDNLDPQERYTYIFEGNSQVLDHILLNSNLEDLLMKVEVLRCNADLPLPAADYSGILGKSDHDPVIAVFMVP